MRLQHIAAFTDNGEGGNMAGVAVLDVFPSDDEMQAVAKQLGYSETVFAVHTLDGHCVRYFAPEGEVPFCGHATIALGHVLAESSPQVQFDLQLNDAVISVARDAEGRIVLQSPPTRSRALDAAEIMETLSLFGLTRDDLVKRVTPAKMHAGADHFVLFLQDRASLAAINYDLGIGRAFMLERGLTTIMLAVIEGEQVFSVRNAFASGGVFEDPATGAAAAALGGYLRDIDWPHGGGTEISQGVDMGSPSRLWVDIDDKKGAPVAVSGFAREVSVE